MPPGLTSSVAQRSPICSACRPAGLKKRCGTQLLDWLDQAAGVAPAAYDWLEMPPSFNTRVELMDRVEHAEALLFVARRLILQLTGWLTAKQLDA